MSRDSRFEDLRAIPNQPRRRLRAVGLAALSAAGLFVFLASPRLTAQGPYQDELHQAVPAFCYLGSPPEQGVNLDIGGVPVLNMSYSGAIKTAIYGLWLRWVEPRFSLFTWRLLGILLLAGGLALFVWITREALSAAASGIFLLLFLSDGTVLLTVRHDWGPVALGLAFRLVFAALWLSGEAAGGEVSRRNSFALGCVTGLAIFEKLSSALLTLPLALIFTATPARRTRRHWLAVSLGSLTGLLPLFLVNLYSLQTKGELASLESLAEAHPAVTWASVLQYGQLYLELGNGSAVRRFILGGESFWADAWEWPLIPLLAVVAILATLGLGRGNRTRRHASIALATYLGTAVLLKLIPRQTWIHHWILGTPWQYLAVALIANLPFRRCNAAGRVGLALAAAILAVWIPVRLAGLVHLERALYQGQASELWSPELTTFAEFAGSQCGKARFIALSWGLSYPIYAFSDGCPSITRELYWNYSGIGHLREILADAGRDEVYLVSSRVGRPINEDKAKQIEADLRTLPDWTEVEPPAAISQLRTIRVVRFSKVWRAGKRQPTGPTSLSKANKSSIMWNTEVIQWPRNAQGYRQ